MFRLIRSLENTGLGQNVIQDETTSGPFAFDTLAGLSESGCFLLTRRPLQINYTICFWGRQGRDCLLMYCIQRSGASGFYFIIGVIQAARVTVCFWLNSWFLGLICGILFTQSQTGKSLLRARDSKSHQAAMDMLVLCEQVFDTRCKGANSHSHRHLQDAYPISFMCVQST